MLDALTAGALEDAARRREALPIDRLEAMAHAARTPLDAALILGSPKTDSRGPHIIAEVKRASPSKGPLADIPEPAALAARYEAGGASAISVLTEERRFLGSLDDLRAVRAEVSIPVLRKDFIADEYQLLEARAFGADIVLLIVASLEPARLAQLHRFATDLGLSVLVEVHDEREIDAALAAEARILGVNTRDLKTFTMHPERFAELRARIPAGTVAVAESGVRDAADVARYRQDGADAVLVGEALVTDGDPESRVAEFGRAA
ncbi:indole-3-glycerol phosphate synthase TrpC [Agrococcus sp. HG114]|uniref:indole-3-glycerol phosphate synthase TrpC n=1 Tax=Agrococcus sp. HG114 TaxID=2969757 RepID=UPI00215AC717|nr:indole-3-glycerol phosphate synthase TrpC [Agrococcus sp. HG114]MCR8670674.1 indole-3-glycerol phosphate synthase TrpC [Agrococcus sp. HG114]